MIERRIDPGRFYLFISGLLSLLSSNIPNSGDISKLFTEITQNGLWDFWNWKPLKGVIEVFLRDDEEAKMRITEYSESLGAYKATTCIADHIAKQRDILTVDNGSDGPPRKKARYDSSCYQSLKLKLEIKPTDFMLSYIDELWNDLKFQFHLPDLNVLLERLEGNSIAITWLFPTAMKDHILKAACNSEIFFQKKRIVMVFVGGVCVYPVVEEFSSSHKNGQNDRDPSPQTQVLVSKMNAPKYMYMIHAYVSRCIVVCCITWDKLYSRMGLNFKHLHKHCKHALVHVS